MELASRHPWASVAVHFGNVGLTEFYGGFAYVAVGEQRDLKSIRYSECAPSPRSWLPDGASGWTSTRTREVGRADGHRERRAYWQHFYSRVGHSSEEVNVRAKVRLFVFRLVLGRSREHSCTRTISGVCSKLDAH